MGVVLHLRAAFYVAAAAMYACSFYYDVAVMPLKETEPSWWHKLKALTMLDFVLQVVYFCLSAVCAVSDAFGPAKRRQSGADDRSTLRTVVDCLYIAAAFPVAMATDTIFWGLFSLDRELVFPARFDKIIPSWHNHVVHTTPAVFLAIDTLLTKHQLPSFGAGSIRALFCPLAYLAVLCVSRYTDGRWLYPILDVLPTWGNALFLLACVLLVWSFYPVGYGFNVLVWGKRATGQPLKQKRR